MTSITKEQRESLERLLRVQDEDSLWQAIIAFQGYPFRTASGLPFAYTVKVGKDGSYNKELVIDRREKSKTLTWGSIRLTFSRALEMRGRIIERPKALGDIRGVSYIFPLLWRFGMIQTTEEAEARMLGEAE